MERLLKKQESKASKVGGQKGKSVKKQIPRISYHISANISTISIPQGYEFPLQSVVK